MSWMTIRVVWISRTQCFLECFLPMVVCFLKHYVPSVRNALPQGDIGPIGSPILFYIHYCQNIQNSTSLNDSILSDPVKPKEKVRDFWSLHLQLCSPVHSSVSSSLNKTTYLLQQTLLFILSNTLKIDNFLKPFQGFSGFCVAIQVKGTLNTFVL